MPVAKSTKKKSLKNKKDSSKPRKASDKHNVQMKDSNIKQFGLLHKTDNYHKKGKLVTKQISFSRIVANFLNSVGVGNTTSVSEIHNFVKKHLGRVPARVDAWLEQQSGGEPIGKISIKDPKIKFLSNEKIKVLKLFKSKG